MSNGIYVKQKDLKSQSSALKSVGWLLFICALFPTIAVIPLPIVTDTQPNALLVATLVFLVGRRVPLPRPIWTLLVLLTGAIILFTAGGASIDGLRSVLGYATVFIVAAATLVLAASDVRLSDKLLDYSVYTWTFVGAVQLFLWRHFMAFLVARSITTETRGVTSLSNEPSIYATTMIFFIILYFIRRREQSFPVLLCIIQIVLFSQSALGVLFLMVMLGLYAFVRFSAPTAIIAVMVLFAILFVLYMYGDYLLAGTRIGGLLATFKLAPLRILQMDESVSQRAASIFFSLKGAIDSALVPHGFEAWKNYSYTQGMSYRGIFSSDPEMGRIMSGYGTALFEMGWFGLTIPIIITVGVMTSMWRDSPSRAISFLLLMHLLLLMPIPLSFPLIGLLIGELLSTQPLPDPRHDLLFARPGLTALEQH